MRARLRPLSSKTGIAAFALSRSHSRAAFIFLTGAY
jgi:hypothetical protein